MRRALDCGGVWLWALAVPPKLLGCVEPTLALDESVQAQGLHLQRYVRLRCLFIRHNIDLVECIADDVACCCIATCVAKA